jgi:hypothetical protein
MYTVVAITTRGSSIELECYGPFKSMEDAERNARAIQYPCQILIEYLWGSVDIDKPKADIRRSRLKA